MGHKLIRIEIWAKLRSKDGITLTLVNRFSGFQIEPNFQLTQNYSTSYPWRGPLLFEPCDSDHGNHARIFRILCVSTGNLSILNQFWGHWFNIWGNSDHHWDWEIDQCLGFWPHEPHEADSVRQNHRLPRPLSYQMTSDWDGTNFFWTVSNRRWGINSSELRFDQI